MTGTPSVLVLGADGFIGRHISFGLRNAGWRVVACARRTSRLRAMGFDTLNADLAHPATHDAAFWHPHLAGVDHVVNAAGVLAAPEHVARAVHLTAPAALYAAKADDATGLLISAVGIDEADTVFAQVRRAGEEVAAARGVTILRAGLVLGDTSYGGSSLMRALAAMPFCTPVVGDGAQAFNPIHADDLARAVAHLLRHPPGPGRHEIGGPETVTQVGMIAAMRSWLGLRPVPVLRLPIGLARALGRIGDALRMGPISATAVAQLQSGVLARPSATLEGPPHPPRAFRDFVAARPAGTQDLWHARLYLMRPVLRLTLAALWLVSGLIGLLLPATAFLPLINGGPVPDAALVGMARAGGVVDIALGVALLRNWRHGLITWVQIAMVTGYTAAFTLLAPALSLLPLGGLLKNPALIVLIAIHGILGDER